MTTYAFPPPVILPSRASRAKPREEEFEALRQIASDAAHHHAQAMRLHAERDSLAEDLARRGASVASLARACGTTPQAIGFAIGRWTRHKSKSV